MSSSERIVSSITVLTTTTPAQKVKAQLEKSGSRVLGAVLNKVEMKKGKYSSYDKYGKYGKYGRYGKY